MNLQEYNRITSEHIAYIRRMKIYVYYSSMFFEKFPSKLDEKYKKEWLDGIDEVIRALQKIKSGEEKQITIPVSGLTSDMIELIMLTFNEDNNLNHIKEVMDFNEIIFYQALVMNYARIDAFFNDSIRSICEKQPGIMINQIDDKVPKNEGVNEKNIAWKEIINLGSYDNIIDYIVSDFIYKLGLKSIKDRITFLNDKLKINISKEKVNLDLIYEGEQYRHSIVHKGGVVDKKLLTTLNNEELKEGNKIKIDKEYVLNIFKASENLIRCIAYEFKQKYFKESSVN